MSSGVSVEERYKQLTTWEFIDCCNLWEQCILEGYCVKRLAGTYDEYIGDKLIGRCTLLQRAWVEKNEEYISLMQASARKRLASVSVDLAYPCAEIHPEDRELFEECLRTRPRARQTKVSSGSPTQALMGGIKASEGGHHLANREDC